MESSPSLPLTVGVCLCDSAPLVWRVEDLRAVRSHGLVGALLGALPRTPRQNGRLGRPLLLLPEEERLLAERRLVTTFPPTQQGGSRAEQREDYEELQQRSYREQSALALHDRKGALLRAMTAKHSGFAVQEIHQEPENFNNLKNI